MDSEEMLGLFKALISNSLGFGDDDPWEVTEVWLEDPGNGSRGELHVRVDKRDGAILKCPICGCDAGIHDHKDHSWRHLDLWELRTYVHCRVPRTDCDQCGVKQLRMPWESRKGEHWTTGMEAKVLRGAQRSTTRCVAEMVGEDDARLWGLIRRAVDQALETADYSQVTRVGLDETSKARGQSYISTMMDLDGRRVVAVEDGRDKTVVDKLLKQMEAHGGSRKAVTDVTRDMSDSFGSGVRQCMPGAHQTIDKFHVIQLFTKEIDKVRCAERRESEEKDALLKGTKYVWLKGQENLTEKQAAKREELAPNKSHLKTARACQMMEGMRDVYLCETRDEAEAKLVRLCSWMMHSNVPNMKKVARTLRDNWNDILNWWGSRLTNAYLEGSNSLIQSMKRASRGFRNVEYYKAMIFLRMGKLDFAALAT